VVLSHAAASLLHEASENTIASRHTTAPPASQSIRHSDVLHFIMATIADCAVVPLDLQTTVSDADDGARRGIAFLPHNVQADL
jgi:hypothetical protein